jgi:dolichol-phosphate mannosyltransferase
VPTLNEAVNLPVLVPRVHAALVGAGWTYELIVVDDSSDDPTPFVCTELAREYPVQLIVRQPENGLSGAVLEGLSAARGDYLVVMDADLQHPPESLPELLTPLAEGNADFAIGSRYTDGGTTELRWSRWRRLYSRVATALARPIAGETHDPMSGFFALRRTTFERARFLTPLGYKIGLELMCKCGVPHDRLREVPIHFSTRHAGESKLTITQQFKYLEHLSRLYDFFFPRVSPVVKFMVATASGWLVGFAVYLLALGKGRAEGLVAPPPAVAIAYAAAIITTAVFHLRYTRTQRPFLIRPRPWRDFAVISLCEWTTACAVAIFCSRRVMQVTSLELFGYCFLAATVTRYVLRKEFLQDIRGLRKGIHLDRVGEDRAADATLPRGDDLRDLQDAA